MNGLLSRRSFLKGLGVAGGAMLMDGVFARAVLAAGSTPGRDLLVTIFLRGGMDALNAVVPAHDPAYYDARPMIAVPESSLLPLDGNFGLHPKLAPLHPFYGSGRLGIVHAVGNPNATRSHFDAQKSMELATSQGTSPATGWLDRHLASTSTAARTIVAGVSLGGTLPVSFCGPTLELSMQSLDAFGLYAHWYESARYQGAMWSLYDAEAAPLDAGTVALGALAEVAAAASAPRSSVVYPSCRLGKNLADVARLVRADVGLEVVALDVDGWDHHVEIGTPDEGLLAKRLDDLASSLAAFVEDLGAKFSSTTIVVMSEFGRRVAENGSGGVDHGHGGCLFVLGGAIRGGSVLGTWPGLDASALDHGDLAITTDYRDVLAEIVSVRLGNPNLAAVFPGYTPKPIGLV